MALAKAEGRGNIRIFEAPARKRTWKADLFTFSNGDVLDNRTIRFPFAAGGRRVVPEMRKIDGQGKNLLPL